MSADLRTRLLALVLPSLALDVVRRASPELARGHAPLALVAPARSGSRSRARRGSGAAAPGRAKREGEGRAKREGVVAAASEAAVALGVRVGTTCAQARAVVPELVVRERRPEDEREALLGLARWASLVLSPRVAVEATRAALVADATGMDLAHGSEAGLARKALEGARSFGFEARVALADTPLAALAVASARFPGRPSTRFPGRPRLPGFPSTAVAVTASAQQPPATRSPDARFPSDDDIVIVPPGRTREALGPLPPWALGLEARALAVLAALDVATVDDLLRLPRASLPSRLGEEALGRIERALGERPDPIAPERFPETILERLDLEGGTDRRDDLVAALDVLAARVAARLAAEGRGARALELVFARELAPPVHLAMRLVAAVSQERQLAGVLRRRLERLDLARAVTAIDLRVTETAARAERQGDLFAPLGEAGDPDLACLIARLEGRLGARRVLGTALVADHRPERAHAVEPASASPTPSRAGRSRGEEAPPAIPPKALAAGRRPARLLARPAPVAVEVRADGVPVSVALDGRARAVVRATGPERIETGFWDGDEARRDYWIVAFEGAGERWAFREIATGRWYVHGVFD